MQTLNNNLAPKKQTYNNYGKAFNFGKFSVDNSISPRSNSPYVGINRSHNYTAKLPEIVEQSEAKLKKNYEF